MVATSAGSSAARLRSLSVLDREILGGLGVRLQEAPLAGDQVAAHPGLEVEQELLVSDRGGISPRPCARFARRCPVWRTFIDITAKIAPMASASAPSAASVRVLRLRIRRSSNGSGDRGRASESHRRGRRPGRGRGTGARCGAGIVDEGHGGPRNVSAPGRAPDRFPCSSMRLGTQAIPISSSGTGPPPERHAARPAAASSARRRAVAAGRGAGRGVRRARPTPSARGSPPRRRGTAAPGVRLGARADPARAPAGHAVRARRPRAAPLPPRRGRELGRQLGCPPRAASTDSSTPCTPAAGPTRRRRPRLRRLDRPCSAGTVDARPGAPLRRPAPAPAPSSPPVTRPVAPGHVTT